MRYLSAFLTLASLLGAVISYQIGGFLPVVVALSMFEGFGISFVVNGLYTVRA